MMTLIKSYTDLEQSKKLVGILPLESADMYYLSGDKDDVCFGSGVYEEITNWLSNGIPRLTDIPCWSLAVLLEQLPYEVCDDDGNSCYLQMDKEDNLYQLIYTDPYGNFESIETDRYEHFVDACYEMIIKLKEQNIL